MADTDAARSQGALTPDEIVNRPFPTAFRGLAETEVRGWLARIAEYVATLRAREHDTEARLAALQHQLASPPTVTEQQLVAALGDETTRVLRSAQEAAADIKRKAEERSVHIVREAQDDAKRLREEAERLLGARSLEAEESASHIVRDAQARAGEVRAEAAAELSGAREKALREAANELVGAKEQAKQIVDEAHVLRDKLVGDLNKRRTLMLAQIEELRSGRERLLEAYRTVKRTLDEATHALQHVESRAANELTGAVRDDDAPATNKVGPVANAAPADARPAAPPRPAMRAAPLPTRAPTGAEGPAVRVLGPRPPDTLVGERAAVSTTAAPPQTAPPPTEPAPTEPAPTQPIAPEPITEPAAPAPEPPATSVSAPEAEVKPAPAPEPAPASTQDDIQAIFARIRAARDEALAEYTEPEAETPEPETPRSEKPKSESAEPDRVTPEPEAEAEAEAEPRSEPEPGPAPAVPVVDKDAARVEQLIERRDATLDPMSSSLVKRVKRALQDEQNNALDAMRQHPGDLTVDAVLPGVHEQVASFVVVVVDSVGEAYGAGVRSAGGDPGSVASSDLGAVIEDVARSIATPLRERIASGISESSRLGEDETGAAERLSSRYREWKTQRVETVVRDGLTAAFALGAYEATAPGEVLQWIVDDDGPCPDCDDNALEATPRGLPFPTGQIHPPAHPGCRCFVIRAQ